MRRHGRNVGLGIGVAIGALTSGWTPLDYDPDMRLYRSDDLGSITSVGSATRHRMGTLGSVPTAYSASEAGERSLDGIGFVELSSGRFILAGGAPGGHAVESVNTIWYSDDRGRTWAVLIADGDHAGWVPASTHSTSLTRPEPMHTFGFFKLSYGGTDYVYWMGGDPFLPSGRVFRIPESELEAGGDPSVWELVTSSAPTASRVLWMTGVLAGAIYIIGGQDSINNGNSKVSSVYKSTDGGVTWTTDAAWDCPADVWGQQLGVLPVKDGVMWVVGSGRYDDTPAFDLSSAVYTFDGTTWTLILADGHGQFPAHRYHSVVVYQGRLWTINGSTWDGITFDADTATAHHSTDGATWTAWASPIPWQETHAQSAIASSDGIYLTNGFASDRFCAIREHTGPLVSAWNDLGSGAKHLLQATDANKPIYVASEFGGRGGLVFTLDQFLRLATVENGITEGFLEIWAIVKTLNFDVSSDNAANPPCTIVGNSDGTSWNNFGLNGETMDYQQYDAGWQSTVEGSALNKDEPFLLGVVHTATEVKLYVGSVQTGSTDVTDIDFVDPYTGWDGVGAGYLNTDAGAFVCGMIGVRRTGAPSDATFKSKMATFASQWGA